MNNKPLRVLSFAVNYNRIGFVFLLGRQPMYWKLAFKPTETAGKTKAYIQQLLDEYQPDVVITESYQSLGRKGERTRMLMNAVNRSLEGSDVQHIEQERVQPYRNLYDRIEELCQRYPQMQAVRPKRRKFYQNEPPYVTLFDALSLADTVNS